MTIDLQSRRTAFCLPVTAMTLLLALGCDADPTEPGEAAVDEAVELEDDAAPTDSGDTRAVAARGESDEHEGTPRPDLLEMVWAGLEPGGQRLGGHELTLTLTNPGDRALRAELIVTADRGTSAPPELLLQRELSLAAGGRADAEISLRSLAAEPNLRKYAGSLSARLRVCDGGECQHLRPEGWFFHREDEAWRVYDHATLVQDFGAGDLAKAGQPAELAVDGDEVAIPDRVVAWVPSREASIADGLAEEAAAPRSSGAPQAKKSIPSPKSVTKTICIRTDVWNSDSGEYDYSSRREDWWYTTSGAGAHYVPARGDRVAVYDYSQQNPQWDYYWTDPSTGCFTISTASSPTLDIRQYSRAMDANGNIARVHNGADDTSTSEPGDVWYHTASGVVASNATTTVDFDGQGSGATKWTVLATAAFTLYRFHQGLSDKTISIGFVDTCWASSSSYGSSTSYVTSDKHLVKLSDCTQDQHLRKFLVSHEMGHALARLYYGSNGFDSPKNTGYPTPSSAAACDEGSDDSGYGTTTAEYTSTNFPEGFAHFVSTAVWNNRDQYATFNWFGTPFQAEFYDLSLTGGVQEYGGRISNICGLWVAGVSTNNDWLRAFWDAYSHTGCEAELSQEDMLRFYKQVRVNDDNGTKTLTFNNFAIAADIALDDIGAYTACDRSQFRYMLDWNGCAGDDMGYVN